MKRSPLLLVVLLAIGCKKTETEPIGEGSVTRDSSGITIVENDHTRPRWKATDAWRISPNPTVQIGSPEGDSAYLLHQAFHATRLNDGRIAIVNNGRSEIKLYDAQGRYLQTIGRRGQGPGEFEDAWKVHQLPGDSLLVIDLYSAISVFGPDLKFVRRFRLARPNEAAGHGPEPVDQFGDGTLLFRRHFPENPRREGLERNRIAMVRNGLNGEQLTVFGEFDDQTAMKGNARYAFGAWAKEAASDSTMWYGPGDRFELRELDFNGRLLRLVRLDRRNRPVTAADEKLFRDSALASITRSNPRSGPELRRMLDNTEFAPEFPAHFELMTDPDGNLWVEDYQLFSLRTPRIWKVFDPQGRFLGDVTMPAGFRLLQIGSDFVLGRWRDEVDVEYIRMHRIEK